MTGEIAGIENRKPISQFIDLNTKK